MKFVLSLLAITTLTACASVAKPNASPCIAMGIDCAGSGNILVVGDAQEQGELLNTALSAANKFEATFGVTPAKTVIVTGGVISEEERDAFEAAGYPVSLPWVSAADKARLTEASIRRQVEEQTKGLPEAIRESAMKQALAAVKAGQSDSHASDVQAGAFAHELGHMWFINAFKPATAEAQKGHAYGGWAPDWLDETAAVLMENVALNKKRREAFLALSAEDVIPLKTFLSMEHPAAKSAKALRESLPDMKGEGESRAIILSGKEAEEFLKKSGGDKAANFYAQVQAFSDFLLSYSEDIVIYPSLTESLLADETFEIWLAEQNWGLPKTLDELDTAWLAWVTNLE